MAKFQKMIGGFHMPSVGLGSVGLRGEDGEQVVEAALEAGYRHIDTAYVYRNEDTVGNVLKKWISSGKVKREELFITTKLPSSGNHPDEVEDFLKKSLTALQLDYVDLYLIHHPVRMSKPPDQPPQSGEQKTGPPSMLDPLPTDHLAIWKKMEEQVDAGRTKAIGVSNFNERQIQNIWDYARIKPSCNQIPLFPFLQTPKLVEYCQEKGIVVVAYSTIKPPNEEQPQLNIHTNPTIKKIAEKHNKSPAQVALRYFIQKNVVVIPKSSKVDRLKENMDIFDFTLDDEDVQDMVKLDLGEDGRRRFRGPWANSKFKEHPEYPWSK